MTAVAWGSIPEWVAAVATTLGFGWGIVLLTIEFRRRRAKYAIAVVMYMDRDSGQRLIVMNFGVMPVTRISVFHGSDELDGSPSILPGETSFSPTISRIANFDEESLEVQFTDARQRRWRKRFSGRYRLSPR